jgi:hypothetical protein
LVRPELISGTLLRESRNSLLGEALKVKHPVWGREIVGSIPTTRIYCKPKRESKMTKEEWQEYVDSGQFKLDLKEASEIIKNGTHQDLVNFLSRDAKTRAKESADKIRRES